MDKLVEADNDKEIVELIRGVKTRGYSAGNVVSPEMESTVP
jgi:hypothetical protein